MVLRLQLPPETWTQLPGRGRLWTGVPCVQTQLARRLLAEAGVRISTLISCLHFLFHPLLSLLWFSSSCSHYNKSICLIIIFTCDSFFSFFLLKGFSGAHEPRIPASYVSVSSSSSSSTISSSFFQLLAPLPAYGGLPVCQTLGVLSYICLRITLPHPATSQSRASPLVITCSFPLPYNS